MMTSTFYDSVRQKMAEVGLSTKLWSNVVVAGEAHDRNIRLSGTGRGIKVFMHQGDVRHHWRGGRNSLNTSLARKCTDYKDVANSILRASGVHAPENTVFKPGEAKRAWAWAEPIAPVVVKPNNGMQGKGVFVNIDRWEDFSSIFDQVTQAYGDALVERFHPGQDHRVFVVDGKVIAATRRLAAHVIGDGKATIKTLVEKKNTSRPTIHKKIVMDETSSMYIERQGLSWDSIPPEGDRVQLRGTANLHTGGDAMDATDLLTAGEISYVERAAKAIPGLRVGGFDLLIPDASSCAESTVLEINENPMISMHQFPAIGKRRDVARAIVNAMFPETARPVELPANSPHRDT
ncbi:hypothetical protein [Nesterenkonia natronophila]|uniref:ATP-grasp domain-containing protein n=1 Tax=Nesterenkonia natronophila TaxID=2174932 RepID=A0A3A4F092_9MICC|nr:hypothetical protein [Nesterenkonia natronophila]RJN31296.1 hypothetical protein D3250_10670 [Nesterenkonia natronophila]